VAQASLPEQVTVNWLSECSGMHPNTVKRRTTDLPRDARGKFKRIPALQAIYRGTITQLNGEFVSTPEAVRRLTIAKKEEIELEMEIKRGLRIPIDTVKEVVGRAFMSVAATIKANRDKVLTEAQINEMFAMLRDSGEKLISKNGGQHI